MRKPNLAIYYFKNALDRYDGGAHLKVDVQGTGTGD